MPISCFLKGSESEEDLVEDHSKTVDISLLISCRVVSPNLDVFEEFGGYIVVD